MNTNRAEPLTEGETKQIWVIIPAYNESEVIGQVLSELTTYPYQVVLVDDGSTDRTLEIALQFHIIALHHPINLGQGAALQTGITFALQTAATSYIITFDADGQHKASDIRRLIDACMNGKYDVVFGSRFIRGGKAVNIDFLKSTILHLAVFFTRLLLGMNVTDTHNGLRLFTRHAAECIHITQNGMAHASEILSQVASLKLKYHEVPVEITYTDYSKQKGQSVWNSVNILWEMITRRFK